MADSERGPQGSLSRLQIVVYGILIAGAYVAMGVIAMSAGVPVAFSLLQVLLAPILVGGGLWFLPKGANLWILWVIDSVALLAAFRVTTSWGGAQLIVSSVGLGAMWAGLTMWAAAMMGRYPPRRE